MCILEVKEPNGSFVPTSEVGQTYGALTESNGLKVFGVTPSSDVTKVFKTKCKGIYSNEISITFKSSGSIIKKVKSQCQDYHSFENDYST